MKQTNCCAAALTQPPSWVSKIIPTKQFFPVAISDCNSRGYKNENGENDESEASLLLSLDAFTAGYNGSLVANVIFADTIFCIFLIKFS